MTDRVIDRRRFLAATGSATALAFLAGCAEDDPEDDDPDDEPADDEPADDPEDDAEDDEPEDDDPEDDEPEEDAEDDEADEQGDVEVIVGPAGEFVFEPEELTIDAGTTVLWIWDSDTHNVVPTEQPEESDWEGYEDIEDEGFEYSHTFDVEGEYEYVCTPHEQEGMFGYITVE